MRELLTRAIASPTYVRSGWTTHQWDIAGSCQRPATRELVSTPLIRGRERWGGLGHAKQTTLIMRVRCRMCDCCRRLKAALWTARAQSELTPGLRNWFGTLTLQPAEQHQMVSRARSRLASGGTDFDALSAEDQFSERMTEIGREVTLWIKRVRKESNADLRYLLVAEQHKSGLPHLHILIHEGAEGDPVRYRTLASQWKLGFVKFNLVEGTKAARYVCKYISKSAMARVRASLRYGQNTRVSAERSENEWKESSPRERKGANVILNARELMLSRNSLTDHTGGKSNAIIDESDWKQSVFPPRSGRVREHTEPDGKAASRFHEATTSGPNAGPPEATFQAPDGEAYAISYPEDTVQGIQSAKAESAGPRVAYRKGDDPSVPF